jgi:hypothetical protein
MIREDLMYKRLISGFGSTSIARILLAFAMAMAVGCGLNSSLDTPETQAMRVAKCGNGIIEGDEQCDKYNLGGATCLSLGEGNGKLMCDSDCAFDTKLCEGDTSGQYGDYGVIQ